MYSLNCFSAENFDLDYDFRGESLEKSLSVFVTKEVDVEIDVGSENGRVGASFLKMT